jgi:hypothetical protein
MNTLKVAILGLGLGLLAGCTGFHQVRATSNLPPAGTEVPFARVMTPGTAEDYIGADIVSTAQFVAPGAGTYVLRYPLDGKVAFRCLPPGGKGTVNPLSKEVEANWVVIPKADSALVFECAPGDLLRLRGGTHVSKATLGSYSMVVFVATSMERAP